MWVSALYWVLYHAESVSPGILTLQNSSWYLAKAYRIAEVWVGQDSKGNHISEFRDVGFMAERVWLELLKDLEHERLKEASDSIRAIMQERRSVWVGREDPFGSEMAWDSAGQEGVYVWSRSACSPTLRLCTEDITDTDTLLTDILTTTRQSKRR